MKKKNVMLLLSVLTLLIVLGGCDRTNHQNGLTKDAVGVDYFCYLDSDPQNINAKDMDVYLDRIYERENDNITIDFTIKLKNISAQTKKYKVNNAKVYRESTEAEYDCYAYLLFDDEFEIESDIIKSISFSSTIPTSYKTEHYYLDVKINNQSIRFYLHEMPDAMRTPYDVTYSISNFMQSQVVHTTTVLSGKPVQPYVWYSADGLYFCDSWYYEPEEDVLDVYEFEVFQNTDIINSNVELIGYKQAILDSMYSRSEYVYITGVNAVPENGVLIIPKTLEEQEVRIFSYFFDDDLKNITTVYIDVIDEFSNLQSFRNTEITTIYYAGTQRQWDAYNLDVPKNITVVYNTTYSK